MKRHRRHIHTRTIIALLLLICLTAQPLTALAAGTVYSDVSSGDWYYSYVTELSDAGVIDGYPDGTFRPVSKVTAGAALKLILLAAGYNEQTPTGSHWASGYASLAVDSGFLSASQVSDLDAQMPRLTIARLAACALGLRESSAPTPFADVGDGYVTALYEKGIVEGSVADGQTVYQPEKSISRSEISAIVWRIRKLATQPAEPETPTQPETPADPNKKQITYKSYTVDVLESVPVSSWDASSFYTSDGFKRFNKNGVEARLGVDVSQYQGDIDWQKVKADGIEFAIIRVGGRGYGSEGKMYDDKNFDKNIRGALAAGLDVGVYYFSQAITVAEAVEEANYVLAKIQGYNITCPVVFDWEVIGKDTARTYGLDTETLCACANTFCGMIAGAGYTPMIYFTSYAGYIKYDLSQVQSYQFWFAEYDVSKPSFYYDFQMWQYTSSGTVDGIEGRTDMNLYYMR